MPFGIGRIQKVKLPQAKVEFNPSVFMKPPYRSENKILQLGEVRAGRYAAGTGGPRRSGMKRGGLSCGCWRRGF